MEPFPEDLVKVEIAQALNEQNQEIINDVKDFCFRYMQEKDEISTESMRMKFSSHQTRINE